MQWFIYNQNRCKSVRSLYREDYKKLYFYFPLRFAPPPPISNDTQAESNLRSVLRLRDIASKMPSKLQKYYLQMPDVFLYVYKKKS